MSHTFVLFDFDGVIADTFELASALAKRYCVLNTAEEYRRRFEGNIYDEFSKIDLSKHGSECNHDLDWWSEYTKGVKSAMPFEGIVEAIRNIAESHTLAIVTSGSKDFIMPFLEKHYGSNPFADILDHEVHRSKVVKMGMLFEKHSVSSRDCVFVTDTLGDMREAQEHDMGVIGCSWGFHPRETLERGVPFRIVDQPRELPDAVEDYFSRSTLSS